MLILNTLNWRLLFTCFGIPFLLRSILPNFPGNSSSGILKAFSSPSSSYLCSCTDPLPASTILPSPRLLVLWLLIPPLHFSYSASSSTPPPPSSRLQTPAPHSPPPPTCTPAPHRPPTSNSGSSSTPPHFSSTSNSGSSTTTSPPRTPGPHPRVSSNTCPLTAVFFP